MTGRFGIASFWGPVEPLSPGDFSRIKKAKIFLMSCLAIEEAYDILISNYVDFEKSMMGAIIDDMARLLPRYEEGHREIDRKIVNLLASGQMFTDHLCGNAKRLFGKKTKPTSEVEAAFEAARARLFGFRAAELLRDAVLHQALPITAWTTSRHRHADGASVRLQHSFEVAFELDLLAQSRQPDADLIEQLQSRVDERGCVSWVPIVREYVEGLSGVLARAREVLEEDEKTATTLLAETVSGYEERHTNLQFERFPQSVAAVELDEHEERVRQIALDFGFEERMAPLRSKNVQLTNLRLREILG